MRRRNSSLGAGGWEPEQAVVAYAGASGGGGACGSCKTRRRRRRRRPLLALTLLLASFGAVPASTVCLCASGFFTVEGLDNYQPYGPIFQIFS